MGKLNMGKLNNWGQVANNNHRIGISLLLANCAIIVKPTFQWEHVTIFCLYVDSMTFIALLKSGPGCSKSG